MNAKWKTLTALLLAMVLLCALAFAEEAEDSEDSLRELLTMTARRDDIVVFEYGDYDCDGINEAFALFGEGDMDEGYIGELWFVSPRECACIWEEDSYLYLEKVGQGPMLFAAERWYGGSGSSSAVWGVSRSARAEVMGDEFEGIRGGDLPNEFLMFPSAFDNFPDGTGHTWKCYYFFLEGLELREYGGIAVDRSELEAVPGAAEILSGAEAEGWRIGEIYFRGNGIINVNLYSPDTNDNLTLRYDGSAVTETGERYGGTYQASSGLAPAVFPSSAFELDTSIAEG